MLGPQDEFLNHRELAYAAKKTRAQGRQRRAILIFSPFMIAMFAGIIWIVNQQIHHYDIESVAIVALLLLLEALFILLTVITWSRKLRLNKKRQTVTGKLDKITVRNPNGGDSETYYIDDCQILWPLEAGLIREQD